MVMVLTSRSREEEEEECSRLIATPSGSSSDGNGEFKISMKNIKDDALVQLESERKRTSKSKVVFATFCFVFLALFLLIFVASINETWEEPLFRITSIAPVSSEFTDTTANWNGNVTLQISNYDQHASFFIDSSTISQSRAAILYRESSFGGLFDRGPSFISKGSIVSPTYFSLVGEGTGFITVSLNSSTTKHYPHNHEFDKKLARQRSLDKKIVVTFELDSPFLVVTRASKRTSTFTNYYDLTVRCNNVNIMCDCDAPPNTPMQCFHDDTCEYELRGR